MLALMFNASLCAGQDAKKIAIEEFIKTACAKDTAFQQILVDELKLKYLKSIRLPAEDLVLEIENRYNFLLDPYEEVPENTVSLSRLFSHSGIKLTAEYTSSVSPTTRKVTSGLTFEVSQPIAENVFGRNTRLLDKITGIEIDVVRYQIVEAYEDYLASLIAIYYNWYSAYENLKTAQNSYNENLKLLENIKEREKSRIALPIDVNKITLQVMQKKENLLDRQNEYDDRLNEIKEAMRYYNDELALEPKESEVYTDSIIDFSKAYEQFRVSSRTAKVLRLLEEQSSFEVDKFADELLPSINLLFGYELDGTGHDIRSQKKSAYAGVSLDWPLPGQVEKANYEVSKIDLRKSKLSSETTHMRIYTDLKNLDNQMIKERELIKLADEKIKLAEDIVKDEKENYSLGRSTLNDLIDEVNKLEDNKFNKITHTILLRKLTVEWLRLSDNLVKENEILSR